MPAKAGPPLGALCESEMSETHERLTPREAEVLRALMAGGDVADVAASLTISIATARTHIKRLHVKTHTHSLSGLVGWGYEHIGELPA